MSEMKTKQQVKHKVIVVSNEPEKIQRSYVVALVLSIGFGWLGLDQLYLGKYLKAVVKFLTLGLFGVLWLVDIYYIATKSVEGISWDGSTKGLSETATNKNSNATVDHKGKPNVVINVVVIILLLSVISVVSREIFNISNPSSSDTGNLLSNTLWQDYTSTKFGFTVKFPGLATAENSNNSVNGITVPMTFYTRANGDKAYMVGAVEYPSSIDMSDVDARLEGGLNGSIQNQTSLTATLVSSSFSQISGYRSINGVATASAEGKTYNEYVAAFLKGNTMYMFMTIGAPQSDFNTLVGSFSFAQ